MFEWLPKCSLVPQVCTDSVTVVQGTVATFSFGLNAPPEFFCSKAGTAGCSVSLVVVFPETGQEEECDGDKIPYVRLFFNLKFKCHMVIVYLI